MSPRCGWTTPSARTHIGWDADNDEGSVTSADLLNGFALHVHQIPQLITATDADRMPSGGAWLPGLGNSDQPATCST